MKNHKLHRITSTAIIVKGGLSVTSGQDRYLITQRSWQKKAFPGKWTVPGGGLELEDYINTKKTTRDHWYFAIENSLRREIREEVNLAVGKLNYLLDIAFVRPDGVPCIILSFFAAYKSGKVKLDEDSIDFQWVSLKELKKYDLVEGLLEEIEMVDKILKKGNDNRIKYRKK